MSGIILSLSRIENVLFHRNLFVSNGSDGLHRNDFPPPHPTWAEFFNSLANRKWTFPSESIRVQWIRWTPSERLSTPFIQHERNFSKSLTNRKWTFPSESIRVQCIQTLGRTLHHETSGFPMESKRIRLDSDRQYWTTLLRGYMWIEIQGVVVFCHLGQVAVTNHCASFPHCKFHRTRLTVPCELPQIITSP